MVIGEGMASIGVEVIATNDTFGTGNDEKQSND